MFNRPRCRDWTALATQQLRLRNLIQISGHNIQCDPDCCIYFTLHMTSMSAPFYTSEKLDIRKTAIWPEINCRMIFKSTAHSVCVRVWQHSPSNTIIDGQSIDELGTDQVLFLWGVYFSGLVPISKRTDVKLRENCLVFHMHGGFFTSADCLLADSVPRQLEMFGIATVHKLKVTADQSCDQLVLSRNGLSNCDQLNDGNKQQSLVDQSVQSSPPKNVRESKSTKLNTIAESPDHIVNDPNALKVRFAEKNFFKSEIRRSYDVKKLLILQEKQRQIRNRSKSAKEVMDKICMKSAFCLNLELIANKQFLLRPRGNPSMGRTLNRLLFQQPEPAKPEILLKAQEMRRQIETAKFRCRLLLQEKNQAMVNIRKFERKLGEIGDANIEHEAWLMANYRELGKDKEALTEFRLMTDRQKELYDGVIVSLHERQQQILRELKEIYCIKRTDRGVYTINGAALPNADSYMDIVSPSDISVAMGYAAHVTLMCSVILDCPLRNTIVHKGSMSMIRDNTKVMPDNDREFPLFCRHNPPPESLLYAAYLLNQNVSQLKYMLGFSKDLRAILPNILQLLNSSPKDIRTNSLLEITPKQPKSSETSSSSIDLVRLSVNGLCQSDLRRENRVSRSVESYPNESISNTKSHFTSDPTLCGKSTQLKSNYNNDNDNI